MKNTIKADDPMVDINYLKATFNRSRRAIEYWVQKKILPPPMKIQNRNVWFRSQIDSVVNGFSDTAE